MTLKRSQGKLRYGFKGSYRDIYGTLFLGFPVSYYFWKCLSCDTDYIEINGQIMLNGQAITDCPYCKR
jgi:rubrerythrin